MSVTNERISEIAEIKARLLDLAEDRKSFFNDDGDDEVFRDDCDALVSAAELLDLIINNPTDGTSRRQLKQKAREHREENERLRDALIGAAIITATAQDEIKRLTRERASDSERIARAVKDLREALIGEGITSPCMFCINYRGVYENCVYDRNCENEAWQWRGLHAASDGLEDEID